MFRGPKKEAQFFAEEFVYIIYRKESLKWIDLSGIVERNEYLHMERQGPWCVCGQVFV